MSITPNPQKKLVQLERPAKYLVIDAANTINQQSIAPADIDLHLRTTETHLQNAFTPGSILEVNLLEPNSVHKALALARGVIIDPIHLPVNCSNLIHRESYIALIALQAGKLVDTANAMGKPLITPHHKSFSQLPGPAYETLEERARLVSDFIRTIPIPVHPPYREF